MKVNMISKKERFNAHLINIKKVNDHCEIKKQKLFKFLSITITISKVRAFRV